MKKRIFSSGGGVQSWTAQILAGLGQLDYDTFVFSNVGEDSEKQETLDFVENVMKPHAKQHGLEFIEIRKTGKRDTVYKTIMADNLTIPIPVYLNHGSYVHRVCTSEFKIRAVERWAKNLGVTELEVGLGISVDEIHRASVSVWEDGDIVEKRMRLYPLIEKRLTRKECVKIIIENGYPIAPKSACYFCPFQSLDAWKRMKNNKPELFEKSVEIEDKLKEKAGKIQEHTGKKTFVSMIKKIDSLRNLGDQMSMLGDEFDNCESGYCMT